MKFSKYLEDQSVPEWRKTYINYKGLKKKLKQVEKYRRYKEKKAAAELIHVFQEFEDNDASCFWSSQQELMRPQSTISKMSSKFNVNSDDRPHSRQGSFNTSRATFSALDEVLLHANSLEQKFFHSLNDELDKVTQFYNEKEREAKLKLNALKVQIQLITEYGHHLLDIGLPVQKEFLPPEFFGHHRFYDWFKHQDPHTQPYTLSEFSPNFDYVGDQRISYNVARNRLKKAITEYYRSLDFLKSYKTLNETGFQKILKKFDKIAGWKASNLYMQNVKKYNWITSSSIDYLITETEAMYITEFADGHRRRGMQKLRTPERDKDYDSTILRIGLFLGIAMPLLFQFFCLAIDPKTAKQSPNLLTNLQIYACFLLPILFSLGFSANLVIWHRSRINYKFIFELDSRQNLDYHQFAELPALLLLVSSFVMYLDLSQWFFPTIPSELYPLILFLILIGIMLCPFDILYRSSRKWLGVTLGRIILSFCFPVEFRDFFIADELNSLSYSLWTFSYFFCAYSWNWVDLDGKCNMAQMWVAPTLASLPPLWRLLQCLRRYRDSNEKVHLLNAAKYISSIMATFATGARRIYPSIPVSAFWFLACLINSIYTSTWDIKMDWGLLQSNSKYFLLRNELVFRKWAYYTAAPINILLRFTWTLSIVPLRINGLALGVLLAALECYRRIQWNFFRLENEHLNNCGQYRAIKEIPLPFALLETDLAPEALCDEERISTCSSKSIPPKQENYSTISMPSKKDKSHSLASTMAIPASHYSYNDRISFGGMSESGNQESFYGRRDFDDSSNIVIGSINTNRLGRRPSTLNNVFARIKSLDHSDHSEESEGDDDDDCYTSFYNTREN